MKGILQKLRSKRGASLVVAMLFFLFCAVIGGVVLTSAMSNAGRHSHMRQEQQTYFTVSSAARLLAKEMGGVVFRAVRAETTRSDHEDAGLPSQSLTVTPAGGSLTAPVESWAGMVYGGSALSVDPLEFLVESRLEPVAVACSMDAGYQITLVFRLEEDTGYAIRLVFPADVVENTIYESEDVYGEVAGPGGVRTEEYLYTLTTTITTTTVTWEKALAAKEES